VRKRDLDKFRKILQSQRELLLENARRALSGDIHLDPDDFPDEMDAASSEINLAFLGRLRERERHLISKIDEALAKIENNEYGLCETCGEEIGIKRLEARPVAELCIDCKSEQERLERRMG
jgi:DnaK suppressor protein